jgi:hypothetical protein
MTAADTTESGNRHALGTKPRLLGRGDPADRPAECRCVVERLLGALSIRHHETPALGTTAESCCQIGAVTPACGRHAVRIFPDRCFPERAARWSPLKSADTRNSRFEHATLVPAFRNLPPCNEYGKMAPLREAAPLIVKPHA